MISDPNASRRNLTITSMAFIIFYWGEGTIIGETIKLPLINVALDNPSFLTGLAWFMISWFAFRYWQTNHTEAIDYFKGDLNVGFSSLNNKSALRLVNRLAPEPALRISRLKIEKDNWIIEYQCEAPNGRGSTHIVSRPLTLKKGEGVLLKFRAYINAMKGSRDAFSARIAPYILFIVAIFPYLWDLNTPHVLGFILNIIYYLDQFLVIHY